jgi:hypothetical protein
VHPGTGPSIAALHRMRRAALKLLKGCWAALAFILLAAGVIG